MVVNFCLRISISYVERSIYVSCFRAWIYERAIFNRTFQFPTGHVPFPSDAVILHGFGVMVPLCRFWMSRRSKSLHSTRDIFIKLVAYLLFHSLWSFQDFRPWVASWLFATWQLVHLLFLESVYITRFILLIRALYRGSCIYYYLDKI